MDSASLTCAEVVIKVAKILVSVRKAKLEHGDKLDKLELYLETFRDIVLNLKPTDALYARALNQMKKCEEVLDKRLTWRFLQAVAESLDWAESLDTELKPFREYLDLFHISLNLQYLRTL